jgi:hypothetical protein
MHDKAIEPAVGDEHVAAATERHHGNTRARNGGSDSAQGLVIVDNDHRCGSAANPIGRERAHRDIDGDLVTDLIHQAFDHGNEDGIHAAPRFSSRPIT